MREYAAVWGISAATIARKSTHRLQDQLEHERDAGVQKRLSTRIGALTKIAQTLGEATAT